MKKLSVFMLVLVLALGGIPNALADEPAPGTPEDNWCYLGGDWDDGRCVTLWHWVCGWYMARYEAGTLSREQVIKICEHLLPALPEAIAEASGAPSIAKAGCFQASFPAFYFRTNGAVVQLLPGPLTFAYSDPTCTTLSAGSTVAIAFIWALTPVEALTLCQGIGGNSVTPQSEPFFYACFV